ncbi:SRPBCC family protein [Mycolicibacterium goodii]|uniref:SRPBCC family protein n=1 Tax=Mycolicibacterium goodii TaxID=134601 RepID=UPI001BDCFA2F|nr:SRPBCC family protein [Mycolicibacterium goodii]MBU8829529.1 SRPBCC family protein [Mycolicibacterium goodii]
MELVNEFSVDAPLDVAWSALTDIPRVVGCIPGAELESHDGDDYRAKVKVKVGPVGLTLAGTATVVSRDDTAHQMVVRGAARDRKGQGTAEAVVRISARDDAGRAHVTVRTDLELGGRISQFGSGVISQVSNRIIGQFVTRLNALITAPGDATTATPAQPTKRLVDHETDWQAIVLTAIAGVALGLAIGRTAERVA